jgi:predicted enzyme related to lactoylglutathione lyase
MRYVHTNLIAKDWKSLSNFYIEIFNCKVLPGERNLSGGWLDRATGLKDAHISGIHLLLPGYGESGPTLEIFQYDPPISWTDKQINRPGYTHLAFDVDDVNGIVKRVVAHGGSTVGDIVSIRIPPIGTISFAYVRDPEENCIEIQHWLYDQ